MKNEIDGLDGITFSASIDRLRRGALCVVDVVAVFEIFWSCRKCGIPRSQDLLSQKHVDLEEQCMWSLSEADVLASDKRPPWLTTEIRQRLVAFCSPVLFLPRANCKRKDANVD